jgi:molybdopterin synthase catalytic subunit
MDYLTHSALPAEREILAQIPENSGGIVCFRGRVRKFSRGKEVIHLEYEAHEQLAHRMIAGILGEASAKWQLRFAHATHRLGHVGCGDDAVLVITAATHRKEAYAANEDIIRRIKHEVPIWKKEIYSDGSHLWAANCDHEHETDQHH